MKFTQNSVKKRMGLLGLGSAVLVAAAALGMHGFQILGTEAGQEARLEGQESQLESGAERDAAGTGENAVLDAYPEEEFFETETDMTEFEGRLEYIRA